MPRPINDLVLVAAIAGITFWPVVVPPAFAQEPEQLLPVSQETVLFDGADLNKWLFFCRNDSVKQADVWSVNDGVLRCAGRPSGYLQTKRWYRDYDLRLKWRWPNEKGGNSGVLVHTTTPLLFYGWPRSMEVQLHSGSAGDFWVIGKGVDVRVANEDQRRAQPVAGNQHSHRRIRRLADLPPDIEKPTGQWNDLRVVCRDDQIEVFVNSVLVNQGTKMTIDRGAISLQSEGTPIEFKDIRIKPLTSPEK